MHEDMLDALLKEINNSFEPITKEINEKVKFLQDFIQDDRDLTFKPITKGDVENSEVE